MSAPVLTLALLMAAAAFERAYAMDDRPLAGGVQPAIRLLSPPDGSMFVKPDSLPLLAGLKDPEGAVEAVEFHAGDRLLGTVRVAAAGSVEIRDELTLSDRELPGWGRVLLVEFDWAEPPAGEHEVWVLARNRTGLLARSGISRVTLLPADRVPVVTVVATQPVGSEGRPGPDGQIEPEPVVFTIVRTGPVAGALTVFFELGGTAIHGLDYEELPTSATVPEGTRSVEVVVMPIDDDLVEGRETVVLRLVPPTLADLWEAGEESYRVGRPAVAIGVILDNEFVENRPPRVALLQPKRGEVFLAPAHIRLIAGVWDTDGGVSQVEFFVNDRSLGIVQGPEPEPGGLVPPPARYGLDWRDVPAGHYVLKVVATDNSGAGTVSQPVRIQVLDQEQPVVVTVVATDPVATEPPLGWNDATALDTATFTVYRTGSIAGPLTVYYRLGGTAENGVDYEHLPARIQILAGDHSAEVTIVPLADGVAEGTETVMLRLWPPHGLQTSDVSGPHYLVGQPDVARAIILDADEAPNLPPRAKILRPVDEQTFVAPTGVGVEVLTVDPDGYVAKVELFAGREKIGEDGLVFIQPPAPGEPYTFRFRWEDAPAGRHELRVKATDDRGAEAWSAPVWIAVILDGSVPQPSPPRVELVQPKPNASYQAPTDILLVAQAFDADGWVKAVEFYANGEIIGRQAADPVLRHGPAERQGFRWLWTEVEPGRYLFEARATDNDDLSSTSQAVSIVVSQPDEPPTVRIFALEQPGIIPVTDEGWGRVAKFLVTRTGATEQPLTVYYRVGGTATSGQDYTELPGSITIAAGERSARLVARPLAMESEERGRTLRVCLVPSPVMGPIDPYRVGDPGCAAAFMTDPTRPWMPLTRLPDGTVATVLPGVEGEVYRLEVSRGLDVWEPVADVVAADGMVRFLDAEASDHSYRFYRLRPMVPEVLEQTELPPLGLW